MGPKVGGVGWGGVGIGYVRPVQFLDHLAVITMMAWYFPEISESLDLISTESTALAICVI